MRAQGCRARILLGLARVAMMSSWNVWTFRALAVIHELPLPLLSEPLIEKPFFFDSLIHVCNDFDCLIHVCNDFQSFFPPSYSHKKPFFPFCLICACLCISVSVCLCVLLNVDGMEPHSGHFSHETFSLPPCLPN